MTEKNAFNNKNIYLVKNIRTKVKKKGYLSYLNISCKL